MRLVFATNNKNKLKEISALVGEKFTVVGLQEIGCNEEIPETNPTIEGNASQKSWYIAKKFSVNCFADDTGLEIEALDGAPGVISARFAGPQCSAADNVKKVLSLMEGKTNRKACFRTIISLIIDGVEHQFEGRVNGIILESPRGADGFGYDPIFQPEGSSLSFAEMQLDEKNQISHRARATQKLLEWLRNIQ